MKEILTTTIQGAGLVGPCGGSVSATWECVLRSEGPAPELLSGNPQEAPLFSLPTPTESVAEVSRLPRLRRSSLISHYAVAAARAALAGAGLSAADFAARASLLLFAASDGSVLYTRRFFAGVVEDGPGSGSPLLFPETVYNAPASHVAADLGFQGTSLSLVGDAAVGLEACHQAARALHSGQVEFALVVAAEEVDAMACAGYAAWGLAASERRTRRTVGSVFSGGAGALLLARANNPGSARLRTMPGSSFRLVREGIEQLQKDLARWRKEYGRVEALFSSDSGNWIGRREARALQLAFPDAPVYSIKKTLGEGLSAATLWQIILAYQPRPAGAGGPALVSSLGFNGQIATALVENR